MSDETAEVVTGTVEPIAEPTPDRPLDVLKALHDQVERLGADRGPMSPVERRLADVILVIITVLIDGRGAPSPVSPEPSVA